MDGLFERDRKNRTDVKHHLCRRDIICTWTYSRPNPCIYTGCRQCYRKAVDGRKFWKHRWELFHAAMYTRLASMIQMINIVPKPEKQVLLGEALPGSRKDHPEGEENIRQGMTLSGSEAQCLCRAGHRSPIANPKYSLTAGKRTKRGPSVL